MADNDNAFELDRTSSGKVKINIISVANLIAIVGLLITAISTWNGLVGRVDAMGFRVEIVSKEFMQIRADMQQSLVLRDSDLRELRTKVEAINNRLSVVETQLNVAAVALQKVDQKLERLLLK